MVLHRLPLSSHGVGRRESWANFGRGPGSEVMAIPEHAALLGKTRPPVNLCKRRLFFGLPPSIPEAVRRLHRRLRSWSLVAAFLGTFYRGRDSKDSCAAKIPAKTGISSWGSGARPGSRPRPNNALRVRNQVGNVPVDGGEDTKRDCSSSREWILLRPDANEVVGLMIHSEWRSSWMTDSFLLAS